MESEPSSYRVEVGGLEHLRGYERKVVFHGVNKSGSMVMTRVLDNAYHNAGRGHQFFSTYLKVPRDHDRLLALIDRSKGHAFLGAHYLYGAFTLRPGEHLLATQFRNPLPRVLSCYQWLKNKRDAVGEPYPSFEEWVPKTRGVTHSQVEQFALGFSPEGRAKVSTSHGDELLEQAMTNIETDVSWFGIAEYFEESAFAMAAICGLPTLPAWQRDDRNANRALVEDWPAGRVDLVREVFRWDFLLYEWALERFRNNLSRLEFGSDLERYKSACADQYKDRLDPGGRPVDETGMDRIAVHLAPEAFVRLRAEHTAQQATVVRLKGRIRALEKSQAASAASADRAQEALASLAKGEENRLSPPGSHHSTQISRSWSRRLVGRLRRLLQ